MALVRDVGSSRHMGGQRVGGIHRGALHRGREVAAGISHLTDEVVVVNDVVVAVKTAGYDDP